MNPSPDLLRTPAEPLPPGLPEWEGLMRGVCDAMRRGQASLAETTCLQALAIAQSLLTAGDAARADDRMAAFVVTHLQLADLCRNADREHDAVTHLCTAHCTLMALLRSGSTEPALQQAAFRHSRETHAALLAHLAEHGSDPAIVAALRAGCMPFSHAAHGATLH